MADQNISEFVLGIDLGSNSLGWALIKRGADGKPVGLLEVNGHPPLGVRIFEAATEGERDSGEEKTRNLERRGARLARRQTLRRQRRIRNIFRLLQSYELLPACNANDPIERQTRINDLDKEILSSPWFLQKYPVLSIHKTQRTKEQSREAHRLKQLLPYLLRAAALNEKLDDPCFLGRALYHLAQRRGFEPNRKGGERKDKDEGPVKGDISKLRANIGSGTLGEYFSRLTPNGHHDVEHIRGWHTHRDMYEDEFERIWTAQATHHPAVLTGDRKARIQTAIFFQRLTWFDPKTIGRCDLEPSEHRAPMYLLSSQRFRLLETVNNLRVLSPGQPDILLTPAQREELISELDLKRDMSFDAIRKRLGLSKQDKFNLEPPKRKKRKGQKEVSEDPDGDEKSGSARLKGNRTNAAFYDVFKEQWLAMKPEERDRAVEYAFAFGNREKLREASRKKWGLDELAAEKFSKISFETRPAGISRRAMEKLRPLLESGKTYAEARRIAYPEKFAPHEPLSKLPPVEFAADPDRSRQLQRWIEDDKALPPGAKPPDAMGEIRNPAVTRSLTELRKVINNLVARHGKPAEIHIELLRELRNPKSARERMAEANRENKAVRDQARAAIKQVIGEGYEPSDDDIRKYQLFKECKGQCAYCDETIPGRNLYGDGSAIHIDHIIPRSVCPDNTFANLVLCHSHCNAEKGDHTPHQAFSGERYTDIVNRVRQFQGKTARRKLQRFMMDDEELRKFLDKFTERQLRDSAYASKVAARYLGYLFGGVNDASGRQRIVCTSGEATAELRKAWGLFSILGDGPTANGGADKKSRHDHRHHAVDAVAVALTGEASIQELTRVKWGFPPGSRRRAALLHSPWPNFVDSVRAEVDRIVVSHRVSKKISGELHKDTNYSPKEFGKSGRRHRVPLTELSEKAIMRDDVIADKRIGELVQTRLTTLGGGKPGDIFKLPKNLPSFKTRDEREIRIEKVRIQETVKTRQVGDGYRARFVKPGKNHHLEIYALLDPKNPERELGWDSDGVVSRLDVFQRLREKKPVVKTCGFGDGTKFKFSIAQNEILECDAQNGKEKLLSGNVRLTTEEQRTGRIRLLVRGISQEEKNGSVKIEMSHLNDARPNIKYPDWISKSPNKLFKFNARKISINPVGEIFPSA